MELSYDEWFLAQVERALAQVAAGQTVSHEEAGKRLEERLARKRQNWSCSGRV